jgi:hypothetical protein
LPKNRMPPLTETLLGLRLADLRHTTAFRLTAGLCAVFVVAVIGLLGLTYVLTAQQLFWRTDQFLTTRMDGILHTPRGREAVMTRRAIDAWASGLEFIALYDAHGQRVVGNAGRRALSAGQAFRARRWRSSRPAAAPAGRAFAFG